MLLAATIAISQFNPLANLFMLAENTHARLNKATVTVTSQTGDPAKPHTLSYRVWYSRPGRLRASVLNGQTPVRDVISDGEKMVLWDRKMNQYRAWKRPEEVSVRVAAQLEESVLENAVFDIFEPTGMKTLLDQARQGRTWQWKRVPGGFRLTSSSGGSHEITLEERTMRVTGISLKTPGGYSRTTFKYGAAPQADDFRVASKAYEVKHLDPLMLPPRYVSKQAERVTERMFKSYDGLDWIALDIMEEDRTTRVIASKKKVRQIDAEADWTYDGSTLMVVDKNGKRWCKAEAIPTQVVQAVAATNTRFEPFSRLLLQGQNPMRVLLGRQSTVSLVGSATIEGAACDLLQADNRVAKITIAVRKSDGRVQSMSTMTKAADGSTIPGAIRTFRYLPRSTVTAQNAFTVSAPAGWKKLSLQELAPETMEM